MQRRLSVAVIGRIANFETSVTNDSLAYQSVRTAWRMLWRARRGGAHGRRAAGGLSGLVRHDFTM